MRLLYQFPSFIQRLSPGVVWRLNPSSKVVYLTFDDGPIPETTPKLLDILAEHDVKASFFMVGENVQRYPHLIRRIIDEGHTVGNHTMHHLPGLLVSADTYLSNVLEADALLHTNLFRPPYGRLWASQRIALQRVGFTIVMWDVLTHDYNATYSADDMLLTVKRFTRPGSIINFHDSLRTGSRTLEVLPSAIHWLRQTGYRIEPMPYQLRIN